MVEHIPVSVTHFGSDSSSSFGIAETEKMLVAWMRIKSSYCVLPKASDSRSSSQSLVSGIVATPEANSDLAAAIVA